MCVYVPDLGEGTELGFSFVFFLLLHDQIFSLAERDELVKKMNSGYLLSWVRLIWVTWVLQATESPWVLLVWPPDSTVMYIELHLPHRTCANSVPFTMGAAALALQLEQWHLMIKPTGLSLANLCWKKCPWGFCLLWLNKQRRLSGHTLSP